MADFVFNISKGMFRYYAGLPAANDAIIAVVLDNTGIETDAVLRDKDDLAAVLSGTTNEHTTLTRKTVTGLTINVDDANDRVDIDADDIVWTTPAAGSGQTAKIILCYDGDTTAGTDTNIIPILSFDFVATPNGSGDITAQVNASGLYRVA